MKRIFLWALSLVVLVGIAAAVYCGFPKDRFFASGNRGLATTLIAVLATAT